MSENSNKKLTYQEKIDLFRKYLEDENTPNKIIQSTVYEGYNIGLMLANLRHSIRVNGKFHYLKPEEFAQLEELGLLDKKHESTISEKIDRLERFCKKYPELWMIHSDEDQVDEYLSNMKEKEEKDKILSQLEFAKKDYSYIIVRKSRGIKKDYEPISKKDIERLKEAGVLGVFGYPKEIEDLVQKYKPLNYQNSRQISECKLQMEKYLYKQSIKYGGLDNFRKVYIDKLLKGEEIEIPKDINPFFAKSIDLASPNFVNIPYSEFIYSIAKKVDRKEPVLMYNSEDVKKVLNTLTQRECAVIELDRGLDGNRKKSKKEIGEKYGITGAAIGPILKRAYRKLQSKPRIDSILKTYYDEETIKSFMTKYFEKNDILVSPDLRLDKETKDELLDILGLGILKKDIKALYGHTRLDLEDYQKIFDEINELLKNKKLSDKMQRYFEQTSAKEYGESFKEDYGLYSYYLTMPKIMRHVMLSEFWSANQNENNKEFNDKVIFYNRIKSKVYCKNEQEYGQIYDLAEVPIEQMNFSEQVLKHLKEKGIRTSGDIIFNYSQADIVLDEELKKGLNSLGLHMVLETPEDKSKKWSILRNITQVEELGLSKSTCDKLKETGIHKIGKLLEEVVEDKEAYKEVKNKMDLLKLDIDFDKVQESLKDENIVLFKKRQKMPIDELNISVRTYAALSKAGVQTIGDITNKTRSELEKIRNLGELSIQKISEELYELGYRYDEEEDRFIFGDIEEKYKQEDKTVEPSEKIKEIELKDLDLTVRAYNSLKRAGIETVEDIVDYDVDELMKFRALGKKSFDELMEKLEGLGYHYDEENKKFVYKQKIDNQENNKKPITDRQEPIEEKGEEAKQEEQELDEKAKTDKILERKIQQLVKAYEKSKQKEERITQLKTRLKFEISKVIQGKTDSIKKVGDISKIIEENGEILEEIGELENFKQKLEQEKAELAKKEQQRQELQEQMQETQKEEKEIKKLQEELKKELDDIEL